jgi:NADPH:quinone reductase-like Zn-dependent oxidoreductase
MKAYEIQKFGIDNLALVERGDLKPPENGVVIKVHAAALNYRDLRMIEGTYNPKLKMPIVPFSDGAGEVVEFGRKVTRWHKGDRVMPAFMQGWISGEPNYEKARTALGGDLDGCLREFACFDESGLVRIPEHLSYEEAATLPCACVAAWHALVVSGRVKAGETVLLIGTGGVSIFALQLAKIFRARVIITSSSDAKLKRAKSLGADETINYNTTPDWEKRVAELTEKRGVDHVIEVGGAGTLQKSISSVRFGGHIAFIGVVAGEAEVNLVPLFMKAIRLQGIFVGSRVMFEDLNAVISEHRLQPVIDREFEFGEAREALKYMKSAKHFGKIVVKI